jgi:excinuclease UvrABC nuclease subunit
MRHWIYFLVKNSEVIYIGCTKDFFRRIKEHVSDGKKFDYYRCIECIDYETAARYEKRWIARFKPKYNGNGHSGRYIKKRRKKISEKEPLNIYINKERAAKLRGFARDEQKTISIVVENALEAQYGI